MSVCDTNQRLLRRQFHHINFKTTFKCINDIKAESNKQGPDYFKIHSLTLLKQSVMPANPHIFSQITVDEQLSRFSSIIRRPNKVREHTFNKLMKRLIISMIKETKLTMFWGYDNCIFNS